MFYLLLTLHLFIGATLAGVGLIALLVAGHTATHLLIGAVVLGFVFAFPVAWMVARGMHR
ncbi:CTP synthetase [Seohaeicola saemankumensis]|nr:CTP synthetase [Seohaeicola saemankumensis]MCA0869456.1 CTP synthetase [Seohaeicola saemankumensis]